MRKALLIASALSLVPLAAPRAGQFDFHDWYRKVKGLAESLVAPAPQRRAEAQVPAAGIDPKMALIPRDEGRLRIIAPPGAPGGDRRVDPR